MIDPSAIGGLPGPMQAEVLRALAGQPEGKGLRGSEIAIMAGMREGSVYGCTSGMMRQSSRWWVAFEDDSPAGSVPGRRWFITERGRGALRAYDARLVPGEAVAALRDASPSLSSTSSEVLAYLETVILLGDAGTDALMGCAVVGEGINIAFRHDPRRWWRVEVRDVTQLIENAFRPTAPILPTPHRGSTD